MAKIAFGCLVPKDSEELEGYMREDFANARSCVRYDLPRGKFTAGFTNCTLLTASEKVGLMFSLYLSLGSHATCHKHISEKYSLTTTQVPEYVMLPGFRYFHGCSQRNVSFRVQRLRTKAWC